MLILDNYSRPHSVSDYDNNNLIHRLAVEVREIVYTKHVCEARDQKKDCKHSGSLENGYYLE